MSEPDIDRINRIVIFIHQLWVRNPYLRLGQLLETVSGKSPKVVLITPRENLMAGESKVESFPADLWNITDEEWEERLEAALRASKLNDSK